MGLVILMLSTGPWLKGRQRTLKVSLVHLPTCPSGMAMVPTPEEKTGIKFYFSELGSITYSQHSWLLTRTEVGRMAKCQVNDFAEGQPGAAYDLLPAPCPLPLVHECTRQRQGDNLQDWGIPWGKGKLGIGLSV
uniref:Uncharacterized protein n=1 Tax=Myotis myotis TaxID=51298 RepID=A0A7J7Y063_MYOMY|nr:hypothetical protein mMyoMyo1_011524 [Myotis myotis]